MNKRLGFTLIETLVVIAGSAVVLATATALLHSMFKVDQATRQHAAGQQTLRRLAEDFRDDAHAAVKLSAVESADKKSPGWEFQMTEPGQKVRYEAHPDRLTREEHAAGKVLRRDAYRLPAGSTATIRQESGTPEFAILRVAASSPVDGHVGGLPIRVDAALGSDHRFAKIQGK